MDLYHPCFPPWLLFLLDFSGSAADGLFVHVIKISVAFGWYKCSGMVKRDFDWAGQANIGQAMAEHAQNVVTLMRQYIGTYSGITRKFPGFHWHVCPGQFGVDLRLIVSSDELRWLFSSCPPDQQDNETMFALFVAMASDEEGAADQQEWRANCEAEVTICRNAGIRSDNGGTAPHRRSGGHRLVLLFTDGVKFWPTAGVLHRFQQRRQQTENLPLVPPKQPTRFRAAPKSARLLSVKALFTGFLFLIALLNVVDGVEFTERDLLLEAKIKNDMQSISMTFFVGCAALFLGAFGLAVTFSATILQIGESIWRNRNDNQKIIAQNERLNAEAMQLRADFRYLHNAMATLGEEHAKLASEFKKFQETVLNEFAEL